MQVSTSGSAGNAALVQQMRERLFSRADKDGDGSLSLDEFKALARPAHAGATAESAGARAADAAFKALDSDADGRLSQAEMAKARPHRLGSRVPVAPEGMATLLGAQEGSQVAGGIEAVMARMLQAYGGRTAAA
ncbi:EF-hand domain-containing protein [Belnapia sp. T6]|uniref:EF-hand domain-containing protein n=1 Tax=Belnapia mucosa TaxID=2804532 RepID=A0ABS1V1I4_9PROT|nr:EF-hand domain-containing protein [Belnapia mucosa]MBL6455559.1 EF-hand domain-containing protein [Belnapia mucosa]